MNKSVVCAVMLPLMMVASSLPVEAAEFLTPDELKGLRADGRAPSLQGFSPARQIELKAPVEADFYSAAYKSKEKCVAFFVPEKGGLGVTKVSLKWEGKAQCNGQPLDGEGRLSIRYTENKETIVVVMEGAFRNGFLAGEGRKQAYSFSLDGKLKADRNVFIGEFAYGVLDGVGRRITYSSPKGHPSIQVWDGEFNNGDMQGLFVVSSLNPTPTVSALSTEVLFSSDAGKSESYYYRQEYFNGGKRPRGKIYFEGDSDAWNIETVELRDGGYLKPKSAFIENPLTKIRLGCTDWQQEHTQWSCMEGGRVEYGGFTVEAKSPMSVMFPFISMERSLLMGKTVISSDRMRAICVDGGLRLQSDQWACRFGQASYFPKGVVANEWEFEASGYYIPLPAQRDGSPFRIPNGAQMSAAGGKWQCNEELTHCRGETLIRILGLRAYWTGRGEWVDGELKLTSASFRESRYGAPNPDADEKVAECDDFYDLTNCQDGVVYEDNGKWHGGFFLRNVGYDDNGRLKTTGDVSIVQHGKGRYDWDEGSWAKGEKRRGEWRYLDRCGKRSLAMYCHLDGNTVIFE